MLNINHPFTRLINKNIDTLRGEDKNDYKFFIKKLLEMAKYGYLKPLKEIQSVQKTLFEFCLEKGLLTNEEAEMYILTEKDFCPYDMGDDFLK